MYRDTGVSKNISAFSKKLKCTFAFLRRGSLFLFSMDTAGKGQNSGKKQGVQKNLDSGDQKCTCELF